MVKRVFIILFIIMVLILFECPGGYTTGFSINSLKVTLYGENLKNDEIKFTICLEPDSKKYEDFILYHNENWKENIKIKVLEQGFLKKEFLLKKDIQDKSKIVKTKIKNGEKTCFYLTGKIIEEKGYKILNIEGFDPIILDNEYYFSVNFYPNKLMSYASNTFTSSDDSILVNTNGKIVK